MFGKRHIFCAVRFPGTRQCGYYRTMDSSLAAGDIVIVPAGDRDERKPAQVISVAKYKPSEVPRSLRAAKPILRKAGRREAEAARRQLEAEQSLVVDISQRSVRTLFGYKRIPLTRPERERLRKKYEKKYPDVLCVERVPVPREDPLAWIDRAEDYRAMVED